MTVETQAQEEGERAKQDKEALAAELEGAQRQGEHVAHQLAEVQLELDKHRKQQQEEETAAKGDDKEEEGEEVKGLRRRVAYWRQRDQSREEAREREMQEQRDAEGARYKQRLKDEEALAEARSECERLGRLVRALEVGAPR